MPFDRSHPGPPDAAGQPEMDRLMEDIQAYLRADGQPVVAEDEPALEGEPEMDVSGRFLPGGSPHVMARVGTLARYGSYVAQALAMFALAGVVSVSWTTWVHMALAVIAVLGAGLVSVILLLGVDARIRLLCDVESNTRRIAANKQKIAQLLERIWIV